MPNDKQGMSTAIYSLWLIAIIGITALCFYAITINRKTPEEKRIEAEEDNRAKIEKEKITEQEKAAKALEEMNTESDDIIESYKATNFNDADDKTIAFLIADTRFSLNPQFWRITVSAKNNPENYIAALTIRIKSKRSGKLTPYIQELSAKTIQEIFENPNCSGVVKVKLFIELAPGLSEPVQFLTIDITREAAALVNWKLVDYNSRELMELSEEIGFIWYLNPNSLKS